jgi:hypothetical protein
MLAEIALKRLYRISLSKIGPIFGCPFQTKLSLVPPTYGGKSSYPNHLTAEWGWGRPRPLQGMMLQLPTMPPVRGSELVGGMKDVPESYSKISSGSNWTILSWAAKAKECLVRESLEEKGGFPGMEEEEARGSNTRGNIGGSLHLYGDLCKDYTYRLFHLLCIPQKHFYAFSKQVIHAECKTV